MIPQLDRKNPAVSAATVGWQISHSLKVINAILSTLKTSNAHEYEKKFNFKRLLVLTTGRIPRGKVRAPSIVEPDAELNQEKIKRQLSEVKQQMHGLEDLPKKAFSRHPFFHHLNRNQTFKFLVIHTEHHLKIARDILR